ncbi:hypothetical protein [Helicobacter sp. T3_23-1056]
MLFVYINLCLENFIKSKNLKSCQNLRQIFLASVKDFGIDFGISKSGESRATLHSKY